MFHTVLGGLLAVFGLVCVDLNRANRKRLRLVAGLVSSGLVIVIGVAELLFGLGVIR